MYSKYDVALKMTYEINYDNAIKEAKRKIYESDIVVFPNKTDVNLARAFIDLRSRYNQAVEMISFLHKANQRPNEYKEVEEIFSQIDAFLGEDFNLKVKNKDF